MTHHVTSCKANHRGSTRSAALLASVLLLMPVMTATRAQAQAQPVPSRYTAVGHPGPDFHKPSDAELRKMLTPDQYKMTQRDGTEPAFHNAYNGNHEPGIYVDLVSGEPLFSSLDKFESGTGWPSFTRPLEPANVKTRIDHQGPTDRTEVRSVHADSHLGHVFNDGPKPTGLRYCMNSGSLRFVPANKLREQGYGDYASLFDGTDR